MGEQDASVHTSQDGEGHSHTSNASHRSVRSTYELIRGAAIKNPEQTALEVLEDLKRSNRAVQLSYRALLNAIHQVANLIGDLGFEPTDVIAILLPRLLESHLVLWGGQAAGIVCPISPCVSVEQIIAIAQAAQAKLLVAPGPEVGQGLWQKAEAVHRGVRSITWLLQVRGPGKERDGVYAFDALLSDYPSDRLNLGREIAPDDIAVSIPVGGTTGAPRLMSFTHTNLLNEAWALGNILHVTPTQVLLQGLLRFIEAWW